MALDRLLERCRVCHRVDRAAFVPWFAGASHAGFVHREHRDLLLRRQGSFADRGAGLELEGGDFSARSSAIAVLVSELAARGEIRSLTGEMYPVPATDGRALLQLDRAAVPWFGVLAHGVHLNGWVRTRSGPSMWVARRAGGKRTFPGHLDNMVAGGQGIGITAEATLVKECHEEAGIGPELAARARRENELHYTQQDGRSLKVDAIACFDLELPAGFTPSPQDGEVEAFELWPLAEVVSSLGGDDQWKPNCALVAIDFLLRHRALERELSPAERAALAVAAHTGA